MQSEAARVRQTKAWLQRGAADLRAAELDLTAEPPLLEDVLFHSQQAVEKAFKAFLVWHDQPFHRTHSLDEVGQQCLDIDPSMRSTVEAAIPLTEYAWAFRYPAEVEPATREEAESALTLAREASDAILARIPPEARP